MADAYTIARELGGDKVERTAKGYKTCCPVHDDRSPSMTITDAKNGDVAVHCFAGCEWRAIRDELKARGLIEDRRQGRQRDTVAREAAGDRGDPPPSRSSGAQQGIGAGDAATAEAKPRNADGNEAPPPWQRPIAARYDYRDPEGNILYRKVRFGDGLSPKARLCAWDGKRWRWSTLRRRRVLYRLPDLVNPENTERAVVFCEGERDADNLAAIGAVATTQRDGASANPADNELTPLEGRTVVVIGDKDAPGRQFADNVARTLLPIARSVRVVDLPVEEGEDVTDWIEKYGATREDLRDLLKRTPLYQPQAGQQQAQSADTPATTPAPDDRPDSWAPTDHAITGAGGPDLTTPEGLREWRRRLDQATFVDWPDQNDKGRPLDTVENLEYLLRRYCITPRLNLITCEIEIHSSPGMPPEPFETPQFGDITSIAKRHRLGVGNLTAYIPRIAADNAYNPVADWINSRPWDGTRRMRQLFETLTVADDSEENRDLYARLLYRWMLSAVRAATDDNGTASQGLLVLSGPQGAQKTRWLKGLAPDWVLEGALLNPADKDSVLLAIQHWIVELGELDATFRRADIAALKAFLTRSQDQIRRPYAKTAETMPRRTVFAATVNEHDYLIDETGNRRFWTVPVSACNADHGIDMQQLWAELYHDLRAGHPHYPTDEERAKLDRINVEHKVTDPVREGILETFDWQAPHGEKYQASTVCRIIGIRNPSSHQSRQAAKVLRELVGPPKTTKGMRVFCMPAPRPGRDHREEHRPI